MSYKFGGVCLLKNFEQDPQAWQQLLDIPCPGEGGKVSAKTSTSATWRGIAYAYIGNCTLVQANEYAMDANFYSDELYELDEQLAAASSRIKIFCYWLDGITGTYGFALFDKGARARVRGIMSGKVTIDAGELLPAESGFGKEDKNDEDRIFAILEAFIGQSLKTMIKDDFQLNTCK